MDNIDTKYYGQDIAPGVVGSAAQVGEALANALGNAIGRAPSYGTALMASQGIGALGGNVTPPLSEHSGLGTGLGAATGCMTGPELNPPGGNPPSNTLGGGGSSSDDPCNQDNLFPTSGPTSTGGGTSPSVDFGPLSGGPYTPGSSEGLGAPLTIMA